MNLITGLSIQSLNGGTLTFDGRNFILTEVQGLESPLVRLPRYNLPGTSGAFISNALYGERAIKIKGVVNAPDGKRTTYLTNRTLLINAIAFQRDNTNTLFPQTLTITLENGQVLTTMVYSDTPLAMGFSPDQTDFEEFLITFVAPDPNLYAQVPQVYLVTLPVGGGTAIPTPVPVSLAPSSGGSAVVNNPGSSMSSPIITLVPPLTNPYITNQRTGGFLRINYTINVGDPTLVINCGTQTITQGSGTKTGVQSSDSLFWGVLPGNNTIGFSAAGGSGYCQVVIYPSFIGI